jgi:hypothetical protein
MVNNMTTQNYLMIQENVVTNLCVWDGNTQTWQPPADATMLIAETTQTKVWGYSSETKDYVLVDSIGNAGIGFTWDGTVATTNQPKPEKPTPAENQPTTSGVQNL